MALTLTGDGSITGLAAGGLPDLSVGTGDIADAAITAAKMSGAQSGDAPIYGARAWVNFNGTSTVSIRASGNVTSITDNGTGDYTVNFTNALPDANYSAQVWAATSGSTGFFVGTQQSATVPTASALRLVTRNNSQVANDIDYVQVSIFR